MKASFTRPRKRTRRHPRALPRRPSRSPGGRRDHEGSPPPEEWASPLKTVHSKNGVMEKRMTPKPTTYVQSPRRPHGRQVGTGSAPPAELGGQAGARGAEAGAGDHGAGAPGQALFDQNSLAAQDGARVLFSWREHSVALITEQKHPGPRRWFFPHISQRFVILLSFVVFTAEKPRLRACRKEV